MKTLLFYENLFLSIAYYLLVFYERFSNFTHKVINSVFYDFREKSNCNLLATKRRVSLRDRIFKSASVKTSSKPRKRKKITRLNSLLRSRNPKIWLTICPLLSIS